MAKRLFGAGLWLAAAGMALPALAQEGLVNAPEPSHEVRMPALPDRLPDKPSQPPAFSIAVAPMGFSAPGLLYLGQRLSFVSLDFLDENRLLFTFRVPGLVHRDAGEREAREYEERRIRAVVLALPSGRVEAEALWTVHDRARYLWMLKDGRFLVRDRDTLEVGDGTLELKPFLRFSGPLVWLEMDPAQQLLVTESREPAGTAGTAGKPGDVSGTATATASMGVDGQTAGDTDLAVRILRRESGQVMLVSHARSTVHLPINSDGYLESQSAWSGRWLLNLNYFSGGSAILGQVDSACSPIYDFLSQREVLVTACTPTGSGKLVLMTTDGRHLWEAQTSDATLWPLVVRAPDGSRLAREALAVSRPVKAGSTLTSEEIKGQLVEVLDAADGKVALEAAASPILDAGGNVAISPSGRRVAVLNGGAIQVFVLAPPTPLPDLALPVPSTHPPSR